ALTQKRSHGRASTAEAQGEYEDRSGRPDAEKRPEEPRRLRPGDEHEGPHPHNGQRGPDSTGHAAEAGSGIVETAERERCRADRPRDAPRYDLDEPADCIHAYMSTAAEYSNASVGQCLTMTLPNLAWIG